MSQAAAAAPRARGRGGVALALTVVALVLSISAYALVGLGKSGHVPANLLLYGILFSAGMLAGWALIRRLAPTADPVLFPVASMLAGLGIAMIYRLDGALVARQFGWLGLALLLFALTLWLVKDHRQLNGFTYTIGLVALVLLLLPAIPGIGREINGARLWVGLPGSMGGLLAFQPSEIAKVLIVVFLASYLDRKKELLQVAPTKIGPLHLPQARALGPVLIAWGVSLAILFLEKDLGASLLYFTLFVVMLWVATARASYLLIGLGLFVAGAFVAWKTFDVVQVRVDVWLHALEPRFIQDAGGQLAQSQFALASGGLVGTGLGQGQPYLIPYAETDFIFSAIGEELGLLGACATLLLAFTLVVRGFRIALAQTEGFGKLLAAGLATLIGLQVFVIVGGVTRLIPLTGITLPFVSYGGSSLVSNFVLLALLIRISAGPAPRSARAKAGAGPSPVPPSLVSATAGPGPGAGTDAEKD